MTDRYESVTRLIEPDAIIERVVDLTSTNPRFAETMSRVKAVETCQVSDYYQRRFPLKP